MYSVIVGNIGNVFYGSDYTEARRTFKEYVLLSKLLYGRAAGESVYFMQDGELIREYTGQRDKLTN